MKNILIKTILLLSVLISCVEINNEYIIVESSNTLDKDYWRYETLYDNIIGTYYNAVEEQTNENPHITGSGFVINPDSASEMRIIAVSQVMLNDMYRANLIKNNPNDKRFKGKIQYGDTVYIKSPYDIINGWWVVRDAMNKRYKNRIDFLMTEDDMALKQGVFKDIEILSLKYGAYSELNS